jgi:hypothetical protein
MQDLLRPGLRVEGPDALPGDEPKGKGPVLRADVEDGPAALRNETVHLAVLLDEPLAVELVLLVVSRRQDLSSDSQDLRESLLIAGLGGREKCLCRFVRRGERLLVWLLTANRRGEGGDGDQCERSHDSIHLRPAAFHDPIIVSRSPKRQAPGHLHCTPRANCRST